MNLLNLVTGNNPILSLGLAVATGGSSLALSEIAKMAASQIAQNVVSSLGLGPEMTALLNRGIESSLGPGLPGDPKTNEGVADFLADVLGLDLGDAQEAVENLSDFLMELIGEHITKEEENKKKAEGTSSSEGGATSWIMAMAELLGEIVDQQYLEWKAQAEHVAGLQEELAVTSPTRKRGGIAGALGGTKANPRYQELQSLLPSETLKMSAELQEFNMIMQASNAALKTAGESSATLAGRN